jgi:beta-glucanase (GH16 family)
MKKSHSFVLAAILSLFIAVVAVMRIVGSQTTNRTETEAPKGWKLIWSDEFDGKQLSPDHWNILTRETSKHHELQYYIPDEVYMENGNLRIRSSQRDFGSQHYTSGRLDTKDKLAITYGRIEIRAKLPVGQGIWPAYWLYPQNRDWAMEYIMQKAVKEGNETAIPEVRPWYTEIDMMEFLGHEPNVFYATHHYYSFEGEKKAASGKYLADFSFADDFHLFALEWEADAIRWYIDGKQVFTTSDGVPHAPHFLILNTAIGGSWPGNPDETTVFPQYHDIDYVRVYQRNESNH